MRLLALAALAAAALPAPARSWGLVGHQLIVERAAAALPAGPFGDLARAGVARLKERVLDPDLVWREECRYEEAIQHFFHPEVYATDSPEVRRDLAALSARHGEALVRDNGLLPWRIEEMTGCLERALAAGDRDFTVDLMGQLAHYTGDLAQPFHLAVDYDGQASAQHGIHHRYEEALVERYAREIAADLARFPVEARAAPVLAAAFAAMEPAPVRRERILAADLEGLRLGIETDAYFERMWARLRADLVAQLADAAELTASAWLEAWESAGRPPLAAPAHAAHTP